MTTKAPPRKSAADSEPAFWRVSTLFKRNLDLAITAKRWGTAKGAGMRKVKPGDRIVFYVSGGSDAGYWGTGKVTSGPFVEHTPISPDDSYPVRFKLTPDARRSTPVPSRAVKARLGRLTYLRQAGVIRLTQEEFETIADLLASAD